MSLPEAAGPFRALLGSQRAETSRRSTSLVGPSPNFSRQAAMKVNEHARLDLALLQMADRNLVGHGGLS